MITEGPRSPPARFREFARDVARRNPCGYDWSLARLRGRLALVVVEPDRRVVNFGAGRLQILLFGPPARFTRAKALTLANELARLAAP